MLAAAEPYAMLVADLLPGQEGRRAVSGWILAANEGLLRRRLEEKVPGRYELQVRAPYPSERESVPSALRYPDWLGPFAELVRNYGTPCYGQFDPTLLFAVTFMLMFGMMFGDVGHGLVIAAAGFVLRGRARRFRALLLGAGVASAVFGVFYGSVFGMHDVFTPVWLCPVHHPMRMLQVAVGWGVGFMALSQLITIYNRLAARNMKAALLDVGGLAGGLLYLGGVVGAYEFVTAGRIGGPALAACGAGIAGILAYQWGEQSGRGAERAVTTLFSGLEAVLLYLTNTLSFIRIAAFSISHAAMALAIFMLAEQMGSKTGRWLTLVIGNLIVLTLEGAVVAIQVLRLEYYEGFSRFFTCVGREFKPIGREEREAASTAPPPDAERIDRLLPEHWQQERRFTRPPP
jgi:V/A-type H+-transporting ATPase subunit I